MLSPLFPRLISCRTAPQVENSYPRNFPSCFLFSSHRDSLFSVKCLQHDWLARSGFNQIPILNLAMEEDLLLNGTERICVDGEVALIPTPTNSPNDPLNWSTWRRHWHSLLVLVFVALTAATANDASSAGNGMNAELGITWDQINIAAGVLFVAIGYTTLLLGPAPFLYGRRISYLICLVFSVVGSIGLARTQNVRDNMWSQFFVGASESCGKNV